VKFRTKSPHDDKYGFKIPCFGHAGDGNIHVNVFNDRYLPK